MTPERIYNIFRRISDEDCMIMGLNPKMSRPENLIVHIFLVPPNAIRPSTKMDVEDDLTHKLADLVKTIARINKYKD